jgi:hypothetical protein
VGYASRFGAIKDGGAHAGQGALSTLRERHADEGQYPSFSPIIFAFSNGFQPALE